MTEKKRYSIIDLFAEQMQEMFDNEWNCEECGKDSDVWYNRKLICWSCFQKELEK